MYNVFTLFCMDLESENKHIIIITFIYRCLQKCFGGTYGRFWVQGRWPETCKVHDITALELYPIYIIIQIFKLKLTNSNITFHCDNAAIVAIINTQTSKHKTVVNIIRPLVLTLMLHNITFKAEHAHSGC